MAFERATITDGLDVPGARHVWIDTGEVGLHAVEAGEGPLVVLLHGFPAFWWCWKHQIAALAAAGFHVVAPDLRGYNLSDRPRHVRDYGLGHLTSDVAAIVRASGQKKAHIVGHDWGGGIAYAFAMRYPELVDRLCILNAPHPVGFEQALYHSARQRRKSWYIFFFQLPEIPERTLRADNYKRLRAAIADGRPRHVPESEIAPYVEAARRAEGLRQALHYYRAMVRGAVSKNLPKPKEILAPTLVIWGRQDTALGEELAEPPPGWVKDLRVERIDRASHWVQMDEPERVSDLLTAFLSG